MSVSLVSCGGWSLIGLTFLTLVLVAPIAVLTGFFAVEILVGLRPLHTIPQDEAISASAAIVIPAHDEEAVIERTVRDIVDEARDFHLLVVADNCVDRTAELARAAGASVLVRNDPDRRGKGFALGAARDRLQGDPPDIVTVLDADCRIDGQGLRRLIANASQTRRPCQAVNLLAPDLAAAPLVQISTFAFMIKNLVRQRALQRLADRAHLTGTGMALPWPIFEQADLGGSNIVEDLALGLELAERASPPMLVEGAIVWSPAASATGTLVQRRRWEGGFLATMFKTAPSALMRSLRRGDVRGFSAALDLCIPPLALLAMFNVAALVIAALAMLAGAAGWPLIGLVAIGLLAAFAVMLAWLREGRRFASTATLLRLPFYVLWKLPMYVGLAWRGAPKDWLRTGR
jgi:cellulose synthase/poly-beta-1,6-N-acetylglucosamine synthase-like glycosyltransferase